MGKRKKQEDDGPGVIKKTGRLAAEAITLPQTVREYVNGYIYPGARWVGGVGLIFLAAWAALRVLPEEKWESQLDPAHLPVVLTLGLCLASLLGWASMVQGMRRVRRRLAPQVGGLLFVWLTMVCAILTVLATVGWIAPLGWPGGDFVLAFIRWYPPALVVAFTAVNLIAIARDDLHGGPRTALGEAVLCIPYALLLMAFVLRTWLVPELRTSLESTVEALGAGAIVLQVGLAWFITAGAVGAA